MLTCSCKMPVRISLIRSVSVQFFKITLLQDTKILLYLKKAALQAKLKRKYVGKQS